MSSTSSEASTSEPDNSFSFTQQGSGLGNIICKQPSSKITSVSSLKKKQTKNKVLSDSKLSSVTPGFKKQIGLGKKVKKRRHRKRKRAVKKPIQVGNGSTKKRSNKARLRKLYALRRSPF